ncbi:thiamine-phosphate synthase [Thermosipho melanesiensis]|nr:thiamine-phosphate synthase family protein [Thermosipho melanesiensis]APT74497.1 thiamine-phosphate synthase [Thermosipho melanesiensis]OOC36806.1 thiamine-phosphate synthase [Thermosipho melanesiensis]OOC37343.1 thiamine-phosphate synthase [Thermosipho melanesiensis]OOC38095.1 thiamine-phosphate synthase [Thermosipho melanesiensis]OOC41324.1 thiamine-phosphate synthase [Thermosipho melanesiensis]
MLIISGFDPSSGAGLIQDVGVATAMGISVYSSVSAFTKQTLEKTYSVKFRGLDEILDEIEIFHDVKVIKIGIVLPELLEKLRKMYKDSIIVWNPVLESSSGYKFLDENDVKKYINYADYVIVNSLEAKKIGISDNMIITGGHDNKDYIEIKYKDRVVTHERINGEFRGTGCVFSTLFSSLLVLDYEPFEAIKRTSEIMVKVLKKSNKRFQVELLSRDWQKWEVLDELNRIILDIMEIGHLTIPEVGQNVSYALPWAENEEQVAKFPGRIRLVFGKPHFLGDATFKGKSHTARMTLEMMKKFPFVRCTTNIRYEERYVEKAKKVGYKVYEHVRKLEPDEVKLKEGQSLRWGIANIIESLEYPPDMIYDKGFWGKEAMIRVFGRNPKEVVEKVKNIIF